MDHSPTVKSIRINPYYSYSIFRVKKRLNTKAPLSVLFLFHEKHLLSMNFDYFQYQYQLCTKVPKWVNICNVTALT